MQRTGCARICGAGADFTIDRLAPPARWGLAALAFVRVLDADLSMRAATIRDAALILSQDGPVPVRRRPNATILQGLHVGQGTVIGMGAVVLAPLPSGVIVAGVPARILRDVPPGWQI